MLQKIKGRHSIRADALEELAERLRDTWVYPSHGPDKSERVIIEQLDQLGFS